jgi:hypothetical protein
MAIHDCHDETKALSDETKALSDAAKAKNIETEALP